MGIVGKKLIILVIYTQYTGWAWQEDIASLQV